MNFLEKENSSCQTETNKAIQIIQEEFASLSYKTIINQIKALSQSDAKQFRLFLIAYVKTVERAKINTINKLKSMSETKIKINYFSPSNHINLKTSKLIKNTSIFSKEKINKLHLLKLDKSVNSIFSNHEPSSKSNQKVLNYTTSNSNLDSQNKSIIKSKSAKKIFNALSDNKSEGRNSITRNNILVESKSIQNNSTSEIDNNILAKDIIQFIDDMKNLQVSICKKDPNVVQLKKQFERKKNSIYQDALKFLSNPKSQFMSQNESSTIIQEKKDTKDALISSNNILKDTITSLKSAIDDINSNNKFLTDQLRTEIKTLNDKLSNQISSITHYETIISKHLESIQSLYSSLKEIASIAPVSDQLSQEEKYEQYEKAIHNCISQLSVNKEEHIEISKVNEMVKKYVREIINIIRDVINEEEGEIDLNAFNNKENFEDGVIMSAIEILKKYIMKVVDMLKEERDNTEKILREYTDMKTKNETYKTLLENTVNKITRNSNNSNEIIINTNEDNIETIETLKKLNSELLGIQSDLLQKLEMKDIENEKNQETIQSLLQFQKQTVNETDEIVSSEKYHYLLNLYGAEQEKIKQLKYDYLHLIQDLSLYIENGDKIKIDLNAMNNATITNTNNGYIEQEIDSCELGRINENDLLTDKEKDMMMNNKLSMKMKMERMEKKILELNEIINTVTNAISKLMNEVTLTNQVKEYFMLILRLLNVNEDKIKKMLKEKENRKNSS